MSAEAEVALPVDDELAPEAQQVQQATAPTSPLANLAARLQKAKAALYVDLTVPGYRDRLGVDLYVRFGPLRSATTLKLADTAQRSKNPERMVNLNASALADSCVGIFYVGEDGVERAFAEDPDGPWPTFDRSVAALIGAEWLSPSHLVRDLYFTDDQLIATGAKLQRWSEDEVVAREQEQAGN